MYTNRRTPDLAHIRQVLSVILEPGSVAELRILDTRKGTVSGYFNDHSRLADVAASWSWRIPAAYMTLNPVNSHLLTRAMNRVKPWVKQTTGYKDIVRRRWFLLNIDPTRPGGISSTETKHQAALMRIEEIADFLFSLGFRNESIVTADSGNGRHLLVRVDLPNDTENSLLLQHCVSP